MFLLEEERDAEGHLTGWRLPRRRLGPRGGHVPDRRHRPGRGRAALPGHPPALLQWCGGRAHLLSYSPSLPRKRAGRAGPRASSCRPENVSGVADALRGYDHHACRRVLWSQSRGTSAGGGGNAPPATCSPSRSPSWRTGPSSDSWPSSPTSSCNLPFAAPAPQAAERRGPPAADRPGVGEEPRADTLGPDAPTQVSPPRRRREEKKPEKTPGRDRWSTWPRATTRRPRTRSTSPRHNNEVEKETRAKEQTPFYRNADAPATAPKALEGNGSDEARSRTARGQRRPGHGRPAHARRAEEARHRAARHEEARQEIALKRTPRAGPGMSVDNRRRERRGEGQLQPAAHPAGQPGRKATRAPSGRPGPPGWRKLMPSQRGDRQDHRRGAQRSPQGRGRGRRHLPQHPRVEVRELLQPGEAERGHALEPERPDAERDPTGQIYGGRDRYTILNVTLGRATGG